MMLSKVIVALSLLQGYCSMQQAGDAVHTQKAPEELIAGVAPQAASKSNHGQMALDVFDDGIPFTARSGDFRPSETPAQTDTAARQRQLQGDPVRHRSIQSSSSTDGHSISDLGQPSIRVKNLDPEIERQAGISHRVTEMMNPMIQSIKWSTSRIPTIDQLFDDFMRQPDWVKKIVGCVVLLIFSMRFFRQSRPTGTFLDWL
ncbi:hypothetical protein PGT21_015200 [Puccinia graminis f. sp. tritici]|uniref:Uncharacterized protein n=1 Tax=Puccinia graminis f. sp. tritici TaxID=56615 RepID=A0A5B0NVP9_PUCGR|nr:hypothetical protein PGTUg99_017275 [Puccinia graminis f. sp. tritici]KAA1099542.1 hypothetical protein PGT21_011156 [Puccinia graminis f. sp. tritici]KAA1117577.1 hypothetical protein PGT21_015200 [Puccinia graminis f. sp. tritici]KAA1118619.1 hypothetical protein PGTUg99_003568 [Puccinia graminis f. sp. tritici]